MSSLLTLASVVLTAMALPFSVVAAQACGPDSLSHGVRAVAQWYLTDPDYAGLRASQGIPTIDTSEVAVVSDSLVCARAYAAWRATAPTVTVGPAPTVQIVSFGTFFLANVLSDGVADTTPDDIFVVLDSQMNVLYRFGFLDGGDELVLSFIDEVHVVAGRALAERKLSLDHIS